MNRVAQRIIAAVEVSKERSRAPEFLSTHPSEETRIRQIEGRSPEAQDYYRPR